MTGRQETVEPLRDSKEHQREAPQTCEHSDSTNTQICPYKQPPQHLRANLGVDPINNFAEKETPHTRGSFVGRSRLETRLFSHDRDDAPLMGSVYQWNCGPPSSMEKGAEV